MTLRRRINRLRRDLRQFDGRVREVGGLRVWLLHPPGPVPLLQSSLRKRWARFRNPRARIQFLEPVYAGPGFAVDAPFGGTLVIGPSCSLRRGVRIELDGAGARVEIGAGSVLTGAVLIQCASVVRVGRRCQIDQDVLLVDGTHRVREFERILPASAASPSRRGAGPGPSARGVAGLGSTREPLTVDDDATIMPKCTVTADVGAHSVVGANSVVLGPLPPRCLAAGSPAEVIGYFDA